MKLARPLLTATAAAMLALALGACSREAPDAAPADNMTTAEDSAPAPTEPEPTPSFAPPAVNLVTPDANASVDMETEAATPPDEQMLDDASATGMTARASREEQSTGENAQ